MATNFPAVRFGETTDIGVSITERDGASFTISSATVTIKNKATGAATRTAAACTIDNTNLRATYLETFSAANGYAENTVYTATLKVTLSTGHVVKYEGDFDVMTANDE